MAKLGDIATIQSGGTPARSIAEYWEDGTIPWVKISDIKSKHLNQTEEMITEAGLENSSAKIFPKGTILYTIFATLGETSILDINAATNQAIAGISITDSRVLPDYLYYYLLSQKIHVQKIGRGVAQNNINMKLLRDFDVPLPSKEAQLNIIEQLNRVTELLFLRKQQLTKLDELIKARFVELTENVNTVPTRMGDIATYINGYAFKPTDWKESGLPIIRIQNLNDATARYNYFDGKIDSKYLVTTGDILVSWATHLEAYIWNGNRAWLNQHIFKVLFNKIPINKIYFVYATEDALRQAFKNAHGFKPTMEHIKRSDFENAIVKLPPMEIQNQFADFVAEVDKSKVEVQKALDQTQLLFDSLMQQYFG